MPIGRKSIAIILLLSGALVLFWFLNNASSNILISNARAVHVNDMMYSVYIDMENKGGPDTLTEVIAKDSENAFIMGGVEGKDIVIPQGASPSFSSDGAHIMVKHRSSRLKDGEFIPLNLIFQNAGAVQVKAVVRNPVQAGSHTESENSKTDHSMHTMGPVMEIETSETAPQIEMEVDQNADRSWSVVLKVENFELFELVSEPLVHKKGQGHGHLYINGLKLQRMFSADAIIGVLPFGKHIITVTLNTNDHKAYVIGGNALSASVEVDVK